MCNNEDFKKEWHVYSEFSPFDLIEGILDFALDKTDIVTIAYWVEGPEKAVQVVMDNGKTMDMRIINVNKDNKEKPIPEYWFAFDNHEDAEYESEFEFTKHIVKWRFIKL